MKAPVAADIYAGLGGWTDGLLAEGFTVYGFDIERHQYGDAKYPAQLILQDALTIHGSQFRGVDLIVASPPCQNYSYLAMPWSRSTDPNNSKAAKALRKKWETEGPDNRLFDACFRIQREACEAAGRYIPMVVENVRGAVPWVGPAKANFGSFYLWGDVAMVGKRIVVRPQFGTGLFPGEGFKGGNGSWFAIANNTNGHSQNPVHELAGQKTQGGSWFRERNGEPQPGIRHEDRGVKVASNEGRRTDVGNGARFTSRDCGIEATGTKIGGDWFSDPSSTCRKHGSRSQARKAASAQIAKIPLELSRFIARSYRPVERAA